MANDDDGPGPEEGIGTDPDLLPDLVDAELRRRDAAGWSVRPGDFWCRVDPPDGPVTRKQGWKLHVSATPLSAALVLTACARVLVDERAAFKFAGTLRRVGELVSTRVERGMGGKFITVYPRDDEHLRRLAERLHDATHELSGPGVLSDKAYRPGSLVSYRYGVFAGTNVLTNEGTFDVRLEAPDGTLVKDPRNAWFSPPPWATSPFPEPPEPPAPPREATAGATRPAVLLNGRYVVRKAIRHAYKGGVYQGLDQSTGAEVIIKEARRHVGSMLDGDDGRTVLHHEARMLRTLAPLDVTPDVLEVFTQGGNAFLVEQRVDGIPLREWIGRHPMADRGLVLRLAGQLVALLRRVHDAGLVLRDLTPNNIMVTPVGTLKLIDLEYAAVAGDPVFRIATPGFAAPETVAGPRRGPAPEHTVDLYSLGACLLYLVCGADLGIPDDRPATRPRNERVQLAADAVLADDPAAWQFRPAILALLDADPARRWSLDRVDEFLTGLRATPVTGGDDRPTDRRLPPDIQERMLADGLDHLVDTMTPDRPMLWEQVGFGKTSDPLNVQYGAAGVLGVLNRAATGEDPAGRWRAAVQRVAGWIRDHLDDGNPTLPGLYFGRSGTAVTLLHAAGLLGDDKLEGAALDLLAKVPRSWPNPDVCHGGAGAGLAFLHAFAATGDHAWLAPVGSIAAEVLAAGAPGPHGRLWTIPPTFDSELAGLTHYGFAHGVAGIGAFLLLAGQATGRDEFEAAAVEAGATLTRVTLRDDDGGARWPVGPQRPGHVYETLNWCSGSSGVGTFLTRLWRATGDPRLRELAHAAAVAVRGHVRSASPAACHGLSGNAEFLLDLAAATGDDTYRGWAEELAARMYARHVLIDGRIVVADESMSAFAAGYQTGLAGPLGLLLRLRDGGPRLWVPDDLALPARPAQLVGAS